MVRKVARKRSSIRNIEIGSIESNHIQMNNVIVHYTAERYKNQFVRLNVISICAKFDNLLELIGRTNTRITLNDGFKANHVITLENNKRYYTWFFKKEQELILENDNIYDCDKNNSEENSMSHMCEMNIDVDLVFTRDVFFPIGPTGLDPKYIRLSLKKIDFDAMLNRMSALNVEQEKELCLDRAIRHNILLQVKFQPFVVESEIVQSPRIMLSPRKKKSPRKKAVERVYTVKSIVLIVDDYKETIESEFKK